jgi:hypothetical protein
MPSGPLPRLSACVWLATGTGAQQMLDCFAHVRTLEDFIREPLRRLLRIAGMLGGATLVERLQVALDKESLFVVEIIRPFVGCARANSGVFRIHTGA